MKKNALIRLVLIAWALLTATFATAAGIIATMEGHRVAVVSPYLAFAPGHVARVYTTVALTKDGQPYLAPGVPTWVRFKDAKNQYREERGSDYNLISTTEPGNDAWYGTPYRAFPAEAVTPIGVVIVGDQVIVDSIHTGARTTNTVVQVQPGQFVVTDFPAQTERDGKLGDSGSLVSTVDGRVVGFVSSMATTPTGAEGSLVVIPDMRSLVGTSPAPVPAPPAPVTSPTPVATPNPDPVPVAVTLSVEAAYANGKADGYRDAVNKMRAVVNAL